MLSEGETAVTEADLKLICPQFSEEDNRLIAASSYWCEGIILCIFAVLGIVGNSVSSVILGAKNMRNSFNLLLIALAVYDNTYLAGTIPIEWTVPKVQFGPRHKIAKSKSLQQSFKTYFVLL